MEGYNPTLTLNVIWTPHPTKIRVEGAAAAAVISMYPLQQHERLMPRTNERSRRPPDAIRRSLPSDASIDTAESLLEAVLAREKREREKEEENERWMDRWPALLLLLFKEGATLSKAANVTRSVH